MVDLFLLGRALRGPPCGSDGWERHVNLSVLKNGRARAIRFSTLAALCDALDCQPGDLLSHQSST